MVNTGALLHKLSVIKMPCMKFVPTIWHKAIWIIQLGPGPHMQDNLNQHFIAIIYRSYLEGVWIMVMEAMT